MSGCKDLSGIGRCDVAVGDEHVDGGYAGCFVTRERCATSAKAFRFVLQRDEVTLVDVVRFLNRCETARQLNARRDCGMTLHHVCRCVLADRLLHRERGVECALGMVLVRHRRAEQREDAVAGRRWGSFK